MDVKGKKITVVGLGNSGVNAAILLNSAGARVWVTDSSDTPSTKNMRKTLEAKGIKVETGGHSESFVKDSSLVVLSPGIEDSSEPVRWANKFKIPMIGEMELGCRFCKGNIIAITGTNGKSTVTTLIGEHLKAGGKDTVVCGNIGNSLCGEISRISENTWVVLEVSSFQLERIEYFKPRIALILNIRDDHMDRYAKFSDYFNEKLKIFSNQDGDDTLILNYDAKELRGLEGNARSRILFYSRLKNAKGAYLKDQKVYCLSGGEEKEICAVTDIPLKGLHNVENVLASVLAAAAAGVEPGPMKDVIKKFKGLSHRFETIAIIDGVDYIDDSKGTTVDSTYRALESCAKPVVLIAGGKDKHSDYSAVKDIVKRKVKELVLIGEASGAIRKAIGGAVATHQAKDMFDAVRLARGLAQKDDIVLLSPMCSSFDMFSSYKERGEVFKKAVGCIKGSCQKVKI